MFRRIALLLVSIPATTAFAQSCPVVQPAIHAGDLDDESLGEISGLAASRLWPGLFWTHQDSGDGPHVYAMDSTGHQLAAFDVTGATATDWEDLSTTVDRDGVARIYVGDIGDNGYSRDHVTVWRFREPTSAAVTVTERAERIDLTWPDGPRNAETLIVDGDRGELVIVAKSSSGSSEVMVAPATPGSHVLEYVGTLRFGSGALSADSVQTTGGGLAPDGGAVVVRTYSDAWWWPVAVGQSVAEALIDEDPCPLAIPSDPQGEAIAFTRRGGAVMTMSEGAHTPVWRVPVVQ